MKNSEEIIKFLEFLQDVPSQYRANLAVQRDCEATIDRLLCALEHNKLSLNDTKEMPRKIIRALQEHREYKAKANMLEPMSKTLLDNMELITTIMRAWIIYQGRN